jgi:hypothetical protein
MLSSPRLPYRRRQKAVYGLKRTGQKKRIHSQSRKIECTLPEWPHSSHSDLSWIIFSQL